MTGQHRIAELRLHVWQTRASVEELCCTCIILGQSQTPLKGTDELIFDHDVKLRTNRLDTPLRDGH